MTTELIPLQTADVALFTSPDNLTRTLEAIEAQALAFVADATTKDGQKAIKSMAYKVSLCKAPIDEIGKSLVADAKAKIALVDKERKRARDFLDNLRDRVRAPVDAIEAAEAEAARLEAEAKAAEEARVRAELEAAKAREQEAEMRALRAERAAAEAREAALVEEARRVQAAHAEALRAERAEAEARLKKEREDAFNLAEIRRHEAAQAERELAAVRRQEAENAARAADREHRKAINSAAVEALEACGFTNEEARRFVIAVATGKVPQMKMDY